MFKFKIIDNSGLGRMVKEVEDTFKTTLGIELRKIQDDIKRKTRGGSDYLGEPFARYSDSYRRTKQKILGNASPVNLTLTGRMLNSIRHKVTGRLTGQVGVTGGENINKANWNQGQNEAIPPRLFTALDKKQITRFVRTFINLLKRL